MYIRYVESINNEACKIEELLLLDIKWIEKENEIIFSSVTAHALSINMSKAFLKIGQWEKEFKISEDDSFPSESIGLPEMINQIFSL